jgi:hypothetical protein
MLGHYGFSDANFMMADVSDIQIQRPLRKIWLLRLVPGIRYGRIISSVLIFSLLFVFFSLGTTGTISIGSTALFFCMLSAYIIPVFSFITEKSLLALDELRPFVDLGEPEFDSLRSSIQHQTSSAAMTNLLFGLFFSVGHIWLLHNPDLMFLSSTLISYMGVVIIWILMTTVIGVLIGNARTFARLGKDHVHIKILETRNLAPFARVAVSSTLVLIGALAFFPIIFLDDEASLVSILPAVLATCAPMLILLIVPIWPIHKRILAVKKRELDAISNEIQKTAGQLTSLVTDTNVLQRIVPILNYQTEISKISSWPFDVGAVTRLGLYLIIPPLTWVGAALMEMVLDKLI